MPTARLTVSADVGGTSMNSTILRTEAGQISHEVELAAAEAGSLTTRTDDNTGEITMDSAEHTIETGDTVDVYWSGGRRYGMTVGTVDGTAVPIDLGAGDNLPVQDTDVTIQKQTQIDSDFDGDLVEAVAAHCNRKAHLSFWESGAIALSVDLPAGELWEWHSGGTASNPLAGKTIDTIRVTNGDSAGTATLKVGALYDSA